jgi:hypothetical protein
MAAPSADRSPSLLVLFFRKNWKWLIMVAAVAFFVMMAASD